MSNSVKLISGLALAAFVIFLAWWQSEKFREEARKFAMRTDDASQTDAATSSEGASGQASTESTTTGETAAESTAAGDTASDQAGTTEAGTEDAGTETGATEETETAAVSQSESEPETAKAPEPIAPEIDIVRVSPVGQAVVAGRASPRQVVEIVLDGEVLAELTADETGQFATVLDLPSASEPQQLILRTLIDGEVA